MSQSTAGRDTARSARNPRRRQRPETDSVGHQPRRKRSKVTSETFDAPVAAHGVEERSERPSLGSREIRSRKSATPGEALDIPVRARRNTLKRDAKTDGGAIMTQNAHYTLRHLPSTPDVIRKSASEYHGSILPQAALALVVTREHAYIWNYDSPIPVVRPRVFDTPLAVKSSGPLPLGQLLTNGASSAIGLVLVSAGTGDITYWENIESAESLSLLQGQNAGVKGNVGGLFSGETITDITSADHAGILLTLSSGRIAQVSLRDTQGRPAIQPQYLKTRDNANSGGLFSTIKGALGVGWKRDLVGIRTRAQGSKGQIQVISSTASAEIQIWDLAWSGQCAHRETVDFRAALDAETSLLDDSSARKPASVSLMDFAVLPIKTSGIELSASDDEIPIDLVFVAKRGSRFGLVEVTVAGGKAYIERVTPLKGYTAQSNDDKPHLLIPTPGHSAIISFSHAFSVVALSDVTASGPEAQLLNEAHTTPKLFQDTIYLRDSPHHVILNASVQGADERSHLSQVLLFVKGFGLARLAINEPSGASQVPIKARFQQAIFYGTQPDSILDLSRIDSRAYTIEEAETAALELSQDILSSASPFDPSAYSTMDAQLAARADHCAALVSSLIHHFPQVSRATAFKLLNDAANLAAGRELWQNYDSALADRSLGRTRILTAAVSVVLHPRASPVIDENNVDQVRDWFTHHLSSIDQVFHKSLASLNNHSAGSDAKEVHKIVVEASDIVLTILRAFYNSRTSLAGKYGIAEAEINDGVFEGDWTGLPEPWTATHATVNLLDAFANNATNWTGAAFELLPEDSNEVGLFLEKANDCVALVSYLCLCYRERINWSKGNYNSNPELFAESLRLRFAKSRSHHLAALSGIGKAGAGIEIAEHYGDMDSLVLLVMGEMGLLTLDREKARMKNREVSAIEQRMTNLKEEIRRLCKQYGDQFATPYFEAHLDNHFSHDLLQDRDLFGSQFTKFLRAEGSRGRLGWMNEVLNTKDLARAQLALVTVANDYETKSWNKKVELSLSKLAALAVQEQDGPLVDTKALEAADAGLAISAIQDAVFAYVEHLVVHAMDHEAEVQLVTDIHAITLRESLPALHGLLYADFAALLDRRALSVEDLIDLLTLMDTSPMPENSGAVDITGQEFYLALKALDAAKHGMDENKFQSLLRTIWKRCYLRDDWDLINKTSGKSEKQISDRLRELTTTTTVALGLADVLAPGSPISVLKPEDCLGASSTSEDLAYRFPNKDLRKPIVHDNSVQDQQLKELIKKYNVSKWVEASANEAKVLHEKQTEDALDAPTYSQLIESPRKKVISLAAMPGADDEDDYADDEQDSTAAPTEDEQLDESPAPEAPPAPVEPRRPVRKTRSNNSSEGKNGAAPELRKSTRRTRSRALDADGDATMLT